MMKGDLNTPRKSYSFHCNVIVASLLLRKGSRRESSISLGDQ